MIYHEAVVVVLESEDRSIAMQLRDDIKFWGLFGGWMDDGETPETAIIREVQEELSVVIPREKFSLKKVYYLEQSEFLRQSAKCYVFHVFVTTELNNAILREGSDWRFMKLEEILNTKVVPHQLMMIKGCYGL